MKKWIYGSVVFTLMSMASIAHATPVAAPEIDPAGAVTAIALLAGVVALIKERRG
jgi:hypothetical protein